MIGAPRGPRTSVIVPVRGQSSLLDGCLASLSAQTIAPDEVIVVDDSLDGSLPAPLGAVLICSGGTGPYAARNLAHRRATGEVLLFLDARSRPRPRWLERMTAPFAAEDVAVVGSEALVLDGTSWGARASHAQQFYRLRNYLADPFFRPYLPTCNLAVRRTDLDAVGGFPPVRSGGDAEACWSILERPGRHLVPLDEVLMDWVPRDGAGAYLEQNYRYGMSNHVLRQRWATKGAPPLAPIPWHRLARAIAGVGVRFAVAVVRRDDEEAGTRLAHAAGPASWLGYRVAHDRARLREATRVRSSPGVLMTGRRPAGEEAV